MKILLVEDEKMTRVALTGSLRKAGYEITPCPDGHVALNALASQRFDVVLTDLNLPGPDGLEILTQTRQTSPEAKVIIMTAYASTETAVEALRQGAYDYIIKPFETDKILKRLENIRQLQAVVAENRMLRRQIDSAPSRRIVGNSPGMQQLIRTIEMVAPGDYNVLIQGPSGTGKELAARAVHDASDRRDGPFVAVNCSAIPETLFESELFGYCKGAFTGAAQDRPGYIARAHGGSLFLDDIDDLPLAVQVKLLRVIQEREVEPVGGSQPVPVEFRLITATKEDLKSLVEQGRLREDLYYRLNVIPLKLPTLNERKEDIPALVEHFVAQRGRQDTFSLTASHYQALMAYHWPGNVRELQNVVERMLALPDVALADLFDAPHQQAADPLEPAALPAEDDPAPVPRYRHYMQLCEQRLLQRALARARGNITVASRMLGLPRSTLRSKLEKN